MADEDFFEEPSEQSKVKARIVYKYFGAWAKIMISSVRNHGDRIAYIDLFAGPGRYRNGTTSTPVMVLEKAVSDPAMLQMLVTVFNDKNPANAKSLRQVFGTVPGVERLRYAPQIQSEEVGAEIVKLFEQTKLVPTLLFVDPWGYKGLSLDLIRSVLKNWGCDCIFFFNYNRVNPGLTNPAVREHMNMLFGEERAERIRRQLTRLNPEEREALIIEELSKALQETGANYVLPFCFKSEQGTRTTHHLIFVTKHPKGYEIMKEIMVRESSEQNQGVGSFAYSAASKNFPLLFQLSRPLDDLEEMLLDDFAGETLSMGEIYMRHNVGKPYVKANYKRALTNLESTANIEAIPSAESRRKGTFADQVIVSFPRRRD
ncbi:MAG: three-Cys-motif partner protein TcmP [Candidatus Acidiferrales bacterium]